jgi:hypothetical protein
MSYGPQTLNPWERDDEPEDTEAEHFSPCACGTAGCEIDDRDPDNIRLGRDWFTYRCALNHSTLMAQCVLVAIQREGDTK